MANLLITLIGIAFCALLLAAGANYISPQGFIAHNQAALNTTQVESLISDYNNLQVAVGHRPSYDDYTTVYANNSANLKYTNAGGAVTSSASMSYTDANGATVPIGTWKFVPGCGSGSLQDCFCMQVTGATPVTYKATKVSALDQMNGATQSRIEYSTAGCANTTITNPANWPSDSIPQSYWLTVRLSPAQGSGSYTTASASNGSNPADPTNPTYSYNAQAAYGSCAPYCGTSSEPITYACYRNDGVQVDLSNCGPASSFPPTAPCTNYSTCTAVADYGTCSCSTNTAPYTGYTCNGDGNIFPPAVANCTAPSNTSPQSCTPTNCAQPGQCPTPNPTTAANADTCIVGSPTGYNASTGSWICQGIYGGANSGTCLASVGGQCPSPTTAANAGTCAVGSASGYNASTGQWTCIGLNGGGNSAPCQAPVAAACGTTPNACTVGTPANDYNSLAGTWTCDGIDGGPNQSCLIPISGQCSTTTLDQCTIGIASGTSPGGVPSGSETDWNCSSINGGATAYCKAINGLCGSLVNTCPSGTYVAGTDNGTNTTWSCTGSSNGGTNASCSKADAVNGSCGTTVDTCTAGTATAASDDGTTTTWTCNGSNGGTNASCSKADSVNGACGTTVDTCVPTTTSGQSYNASAGTWTCAGSNGGRTASCALAPINGACGTMADTCLSPIAAQSYNASAGTWTCPGSYGGTAASCSTPVAVGTYCPTYSACSTSCGSSGTQSVTYACTDQNGNSLPSSACPGMPTNTTRACTDYAGCTYSIPPGGTTYDQSVCEAYCTGVTLVDPATWDGSCIRSDGTAVSSSYCTPPGAIPCLGTITGCSQAAKTSEQQGVGATYIYSRNCSGSNGCGTGTRTASQVRCYGSDPIICQTSIPGPQSCSDYSACTYTASGTGNSFICTRSDGTVVPSSYCTPPGSCASNSSSGP